MEEYFLRKANNYKVTENWIMYGRVGECLTGYYDWTSTFIIECSENNPQFLNEIQFLNLNN